jgi:hypothetical protein
MKAWEAGVVQKRKAGEPGSILLGEYGKR